MKKRIVCLVLAFMMVVCFMPNLQTTVMAEDEPLVLETVLEGSGTEAEPYLINTADEMVVLRDYVNAGNTCEGMCFSLQNDIELPSDWTPIGCLN